MGSVSAPVLNDQTRTPSGDWLVLWTWLIRSEEEEEGEAGEKETGGRGEGMGERGRVEVRGETGKLTQSDLGTCCNIFLQKASFMHTFHGGGFSRYSHQLSSNLRINAFTNISWSMLKETGIAKLVQRLPKCGHVLLFEMTSWGPQRGPSIIPQIQGKMLPLFASLSIPLNSPQRVSVSCYYLGLL